MSDKSRAKKDRAFYKDLKIVLPSRAKYTQRKLQTTKMEIEKQSGKNTLRVLSCWSIEI